MADVHISNTGPMNAAARCGARTRRGTACLAPAVAGAVRCRMHGGKGSGAPQGTRNALKHGHFTAEEMAFRREMRELLKESQELLEKY